MDQHTTVVLIVIALAVLAGLIAWFYSRYQRSKWLRQRFGPEYERVIQKEGSIRRGEGVLAFREKKRQTIHLRPLPAASQQDFSNRWNDVQLRFVDDPAGAVAKADRLVHEVMEARGYPMADFEEQAELISVDHPVVVENYRAAHSIALSRARGHATTETLRQGMVHYRALFDELLYETLPERKEARL
jgi:hypothetical protein